MRVRTALAILTGVIMVAAGALAGGIDRSDSLWGSAPHRAEDLTGYGDLPVAFETNRGQAGPSVDYLTRVDGSTVSLHAGGATFDLPTPSLGASGQPSGAALRMELIGGERVVPGAEGVLPGVVNYLRGSDPAAWLTGIPTYERVRYEEVYPGIDLVFRGTGGNLEYDFVLAPGADPDAIGVRFTGAGRPHIRSDGSLILRTASGEIVNRPPTVYQEDGGSRLSVEGRYEVRGDLVGFEIGAFDPALPLVIDPVVMVYSSLLGGGETDNPFAVAVDSGGAAYVAGYTADTTSDLPTTPGSFDPLHNGGDDAFVTKLSPDGTSLVYSTFLGGSEGDFAFDLVLDGEGAAYVVGATSDAATDFPTTPGAYDATHNGSTDAFVAKLSPAGSELVFSTFLGGGGFDIGFGLAIDGTGAVFLTGETSDAVTDYPTTSGAYDQSHNGNTDAFLTKLAPSGATLGYSTFLGGSGNDQGVDVEVDGAGAAYISGTTLDAATDYPTTSGAFDEVHNGSNDAFLTKVAPSGSSLAYSTFLGGTGPDSGYRLAVDQAGAAYVTGHTVDSATDYPTTAGSFDTAHNGLQDAFVTKVRPSGSGLEFSTFLGGSDNDAGRGIAVDAAGTVFVTGWTGEGSPAYPTTADAFDTSQNGGTDAVLTRVNAAGSALLYSSFLGGSDSETGWDVAIDAAGAFYVAGETLDGMTDYPTTEGAFDTLHNGQTDGFITKFADPGTCRGKPVTILGTLSADVLLGTPDRDVFSALAGNDLLKGLGDKDILCAGDGKDVVNGGSGNDIAAGGIGNDKLKGGQGKDRLLGEAGRDRLGGGGGNDKLNGGKGKDTCAGGAGKDKASKCEKERSIP